MGTTNQPRAIRNGKEGRREGGTFFYGKGKGKGDSRKNASSKEEKKEEVRSSLFGGGGPPGGSLLKNLAQKRREGGPSYSFSGRGWEVASAPGGVSKGGGGFPGKKKRVRALSDRALSWTGKGKKKKKPTTFYGGGRRRQSASPLKPVKTRQDPQQKEGGGGLSFLGEKRREQSGSRRGKCTPASGRKEGTQFFEKKKRGVR